MQTPHQTSFQRRWNKLPNRKYQLRMVFCFLGFCTLALLVQSLVVGAQFAKVAHLFAYEDVDAASVMTGVLGRSLLFAALLVLPALGLIALHRSLRIAGPLYRFEQHLKSVVAGEPVGECRIRKGDDHQELCALINAALESARRQGAEAERKALQASKTTVETTQLAA